MAAGTPLKLVSGEIEQFQSGDFIGATLGGTGLTAYTTGDTLYASGTNTLSALAIGTSGQVYTVVSGVPAWTTAAGAPFSDASALVKNSSDATKLIIFSAAGITTATTRTLTAPNASGQIMAASATPAGTQCIPYVNSDGIRYDTIARFYYNNPYLTVSGGASQSAGIKTQDDGGITRASLLTFGSTFGNFAGTSLSISSGGAMVSGAYNSAYNSFVLNASAIYSVIGNTTTNICFNNTAAGIRIDAMSNIHTAPTAKLHIAAGSATANTAPIQLTNGTNETVMRAGIIEYDGTSLFFTNGGVQRQQLPQEQQARVSTQFDKTNDAALANITGLTTTLVAGKTYEFEAVLHVTADVVGGSKFAIAGTCTATSIVYEILMIDNTSNLNTITSRKTALAGSTGQAGTTSGYCIMRGVITVNGAGTLTAQFSQNAATAATTSSILVGSTLITKQIP